MLRILIIGLVLLGLGGDALAKDAQGKIKSYKLDGKIVRIVVPDGHCLMDTKNKVERRWAKSIQRLMKDDGLELLFFSQECGAKKAFATGKVDEMNRVLFIVTPMKDGRKDMPRTMAGGQQALNQYLVKTFYPQTAKEFAEKHRDAIKRGNAQYFGKLTQDQIGSISGQYSDKSIIISGMMSLNGYVFGLDYYDAFGGNQQQVKTMHDLVKQAMIDIRVANQPKTKKDK